MSGIRIYIEGGGDTRAGKDALRRGFGRFLDPLRSLARDRRLRWRVVACGSRNDAFDDYRTALFAYPEEFVVLLVDSERRVTDDPEKHVRDNDGWDLAPGGLDNLHLMVQLMESWIVADPESVAAYYGQGFRPSALPTNSTLEAVSPTDVVRGLESASRRCSKGPYTKRHGLELIGQVDPVKVRAALPHCDRVFEVLTRKIAEA